LDRKLIFYCLPHHRERFYSKGSLFRKLELKLRFFEEKLSKYKTIIRYCEIHCVRALSFKEFVLSNIGENLLYLAKIWNDSRIHLYCCDCFKIIHLLPQAFEVIYRIKIDRLASVFKTTLYTIVRILGESEKIGLNIIIEDNIVRNLDFKD